MIDSHIHLTHHLYNNVFPYLWSEGSHDILMKSGNRAAVIADLKKAGISKVVEPGLDLESNLRILSLAQKEPGFVYPAVGIHPTRTYAYRTANKTKEGAKKVVRRLAWSDRKRIREYAEHPSVVAIGETGLDYHLKREEQHRFRQAVWFLWQLDLAHRRGLPVILHIRKADRDALRILRLYRHRLRGGVCHCFCGGAGLARAYTNLGLMLGIGASLLTERAGPLEDAVRQTPLQYLLLETDGPYVKPSSRNLTQKQLRSARNTSLILPAVIARIAELKNVSYETVEQQTDENARKLFHI